MNGLSMYFQQCRKEEESKDRGKVSLDLKKKEGWRA